MEKFSAIVKLDKVDKQILKLLQRNSKITNKEIAAQLGLTITPIYERIKRLEREGVVEKYVALLSKSKVGKPLVVFCDVSVKEHSREFLLKFEKEVQKLKEVMECYHIGGMYDYLLKVNVGNMDNYQHFIANKLAALENIGNVRSSFVMKEIKCTMEYDL